MCQPLCFCRSPNPNIPSDGKLSVEARTVLWYMTFMGFIVNYMLRINLNITIVDMIVTRDAPISSTLLPALASNLTNATLASNTTYLAPLATVTSVQNVSVRPERYSWERQFLDWANVSKSKHVLFSSFTPIKTG